MLTFQLFFWENCHAAGNSSNKNGRCTRDALARVNNLGKEESPLVHRQTQSPTFDLLKWTRSCASFREGKWIAWDWSTANVYSTEYSNFTLFIFDQGLKRRRKFSATICLHQSNAKQAKSQRKKEKSLLGIFYSNKFDVQQKHPCLPSLQEAVEKSFESSSASYQGSMARDEMFYSWLSMCNDDDS